MMERMHTALLYKKLLLLKSMGYRYADMALHVQRHTKANETDTDFDTLQKLHEQVKKCHLCTLSKTRQFAVCGKGAPQSDLMFVGEYPGFAEDSSGVAFKGRSADMFEKIIRNVFGREPESCYATYAIKCKPPSTHEQQESYRACTLFLKQELKLVRPKVVVALGETAYRYLTEDTLPFEEVLGIPHQIDEETVCIATYALPFLLRNPGYKKESFVHFRQAAELLKR
jgi:DNA polymerase